MDAGLPDLIYLCTGGGSGIAESFSATWEYALYQPVPQLALVRALPGRAYFCTGGGDRTTESDVTTWKYALSARATASTGQRTIGHIHVLYARAAPSSGGYYICMNPLVRVCSKIRYNIVHTIAVHCRVFSKWCTLK